MLLCLQHCLPVCVCVCVCGACTCGCMCVVHVSTCVCETKEVVMVPQNWRYCAMAVRQVGFWPSHFRSTCSF